MADLGTLQALKAKINLLLADNNLQEIEPSDERESLFDLIDTMAPSDPFDEASPWVIGDTYITDNVVSYAGNLYVSLQNANTGNPPDAVASTWWKLVEGAKLQLEWNVGVYGDGLIIVFKDDEFWKLKVGPRPFYSFDFYAEQAADKWVIVSSSGGGGSAGTEILLTTTTAATQTASLPITTGKSFTFKSDIIGRQTVVGTEGVVNNVYHYEVEGSGINIADVITLKSIDGVLNHEDFAMPTDAVTGHNVAVSSTGANLELVVSGLDGTIEWKTVTVINEI